ncbi:hypothetical protein BD311DRAFT_697099 [Dichomitus squalens]|uniref:Carbohydrate kinase PfkB domain-containing protein n=1 Tax=Dichomitus squalens TaxID=114155 RepID=A0A4V6MVW7_9APHY|nr:hypothetical protein BD311DRAFT_697099 [Dichomitus squalens]
MARGRRDTLESAGLATQRPLRVVASGTLFLTNNLGLPTHPERNSVVRAHSVSKVRGGSASTCLSILAQFPAVEASLVVPLGGNEEGRRIISELERERVNTRYCKVWPEAGVPSAWVLHADDTDSRTVINNNPLPDITHEEFISLVGPLLVPENFAYLNAPSTATPPQTPGAPSGAAPPRPSMSNPNGPATARQPTNSPAPVDWIHFEGRSVKTTLQNITGLDGLARERKWRSHCVFSVDVGRRARQGVEALVPHADVVFLNRHYARAHSPQYAASPRAFLLSLTGIAPPHALLVAHWGADGAAVLSVPTKEYFQSSGWVEPAVPPLPSPLAAAQDARTRMNEADMHSVRTGSDFWAGGGHETESSSMFTADLLSSTPARRGANVGVRLASPPTAKAGEAVDEVGAQDAFVAGMMWALSRRLLPGEPYTPSAVGSDAAVAGAEGDQRGRWRLEECLRFATELAGRKARRNGWNGLAEEMARAGWFEPWSMNVA